MMNHDLCFIVSKQYKPEGLGFSSRCNWFFFDLLNPSSHTMALGFTEPLTEMSSRRYFWGKERPERKTDTLTAIFKPIF
jgi:hypothetical protein